MKKPLLTLLALAALSLGLIGAAKAQAVTEAAQLVTAVDRTNSFFVPSYQQTIGYNAYGGAYDANPNATTNLVLAFYLPTLASNESFSSFTLNVHSNWQSTTQQVDLYGLGASSSYSPTGTPYYSGTNDPASGVTKLQSSFMNPSTLGSLPLVTSSDLSSYINSLYTAGTPSASYVLLRLNQQALGENGVDFNSIGSEGIHGTNGDLPAGYDATTGAFTGDSNWAVPYVSFTTAAVPEPSTWALLALSLTTVFVYRRRRALGSGVNH